MARYIGGVAVTGYISPTDTADVYATHDAIFGKGGYRSVTTVTERNAINDSRRTEGMVVFCLDTKKNYRLEGGILNTHWKEVYLSAYESAVANGYIGTEVQWLASLKGADGKSAYQIAVSKGYVGTETQWIDSIKGLKGADGRSAYEIAVSKGYIGTETDWIAKFNSILSPDAILTLIDNNSIDDTEIDLIIDAKLGNYLPLNGGKMTGAITAIRETSVAVTASTIDTSAGNVFYKTITAATTFTFTNVLKAPAVTSFIIEVTNGGAFAITWPTGTKWANGVVPALTAAGTDILGFYSYNGGTTWRGILLSKDSK